jgi:endogenous inhibitor of DNA gyrase (YacG/DUF329 family)
MPEYPCAICKKVVSYSERLPALHPFCSKRCKLIDLGRWFGERYAIERELSPEESEGPTRGAEDSGAHETV